MGVLTNDPGLYVMLVLLLGFVFFCYLVIRRTIVGFREGKDGR